MNPVHARSGYQCEALIYVNGVYTRCWKKPVETHHMLTRARGGAILDAAGEIYHLIDLCPDCHRAADGAEAYAGGLLIDGYMTTVDGKPAYVGTDEYLRERYGRD